MNEQEIVSKTPESKSAAKRMLCLLSLPLILAFFLMLVIYVQSPGKKGATLIEQRESTDVVIENGTVYPEVFSQMLRVPQDRLYEINLEWDVLDPAFITGCVGKNTQGDILFAFTAAQISGYNNQVKLPSGECIIEFHYLANEEDYRSFATEYALFKTPSDLETMINQIDYASFQKDGEWVLTYSLSIFEVISAGPIALFATILVGILTILLLFGLWIADRPAAEDLKGCLANIGVRYALFVTLVSVLQITCVILLRLFASDLAASLGSDLSFLLIIIPVDVIGFPLTYLICKGVPAEHIAQRNLGFGRFLLFVLMGAGICGVGGIIGNILHNLLTQPFGVSSGGIGDLMLSAGFPMRVLAVGILAPIFEELLFRKLLIDRLIKHGEFVAILTSGLLFGLFHGNFSQFFYAAALGFLWAFVYVRTGKIHYSILMHMIINLSNSAITIYLFGKSADYLANATDTAAILAVMQSSPEAMLYVSLYAVWMMLLALCCIAGTIILIVFLSTGKFRLRKADEEAPRSVAAKALFGNLYVWPFYLSSLGLFLISYLPGILAFIFQ